MVMTVNPTLNIFRRLDVASRRLPVPNVRRYAIEQDTIYLTNGYAIIVLSEVDDETQKAIQQLSGWTQDKKADDLRFKSTINNSFVTGYLFFDLVKLLKIGLLSNRILSAYNFIAINRNSFSYKSNKGLFEAVIRAKNSVTDVTPVVSGNIRVDSALLRLALSLCHKPNNAIEVKYQADERAETENISKNIHFFGNNVHVVLASDT